MRLVPLSALGLLTISTQVGAQCRVAPGSNEARLLAFYAVPLVFSPAGALGELPRGAVRASVEFAWIPTPSASLQQTSACFRPKQENSDISPVLPRPRVAVGLPGGFFVEATYLPPVTVADATPNLVSGAVGVVRPWRGRLSFALRAHATVGSVAGPITCPREELQLSDVAAACYGEAPSKDHYRPNAFGVETALLWTGSRLAAYGGTGYTSLRPRFTVGFQQANGYYDSTRVLVNLSRIPVFAGAQYGLSNRWHLTGEVYSVPQDVTTVRLGASLRLR